MLVITMTNIAQCFHVDLRHQVKTVWLYNIRSIPTNSSIVRVINITNQPKG